MTSEVPPARTCFDDDGLMWDLAQALLRSLARRRARLAVEDPEQLARELAQEAAEKEAA